MDEPTRTAAQQALVDAAQVLGAFPTDGQALRALQRAEDAIAAAKATAVQGMIRTDAFQDDGCSSITGWLRTELHLDDRESRALVQRGTTLRDLPSVASEALAGRVRPAHVDAFGFGLKHIGEVFAEPSVVDGFLSLARSTEPAQLRATVKELRDVVLPEALEEAYVRGMDREDISISRVGDGYAIAGYLNLVLGAKVAALLESAGNPRESADDDRPEPDEPADDRTPAQRRLDRLETWVDATLEHGLPQDRGVRPHISVLVDADEIARAADPDADGLSSPAELVGFGSIGRNALAEIMCGADLTPILTAGKYGVLDVGRTIRCATARQRRAVEARQGSMCAAPGCRHRVRHIHHVRFYADGGATDLENLIGLCSICHRLVHADRLHIDPDTHAISRPYRPPQTVNRSNTWLTRRRASRRLREGFRPARAPSHAA